MNVFELFGEIAINNKDANNALKDTSQKAERAGKQIRDAFKGIGNTTIKVGKVVVNGGKAIATGAAAVATAWTATVESTRDYRRAMAQLDASFTSNNHSSETAIKTYKGLQSVMGDTDAAVEAATALGLMCEEEEDLAKWVDICTGVWAEHQGKLPIEGLAEAANETANVGVVTGNLADALNWVGISEDDFNLKLRACRTEQERQKLILNTLYPMYKQQAEQYKKSGEDIMKANEAQENLNAALAKLGAIGEPILTDVKNWIADMINAAVPHLETLITKFGEIENVWTDVIWPLTQSAVKLTFGIDLPEWSVIETEVNTWWQEKVKPQTDQITKVATGIKLPEWSSIETSVTTWWNETVKPEIDKITKAVMTITPPDLAALASTMELDWEKLVAPALLGMLTGNYLSIVPVIGAGLAQLITSNWDTHIKPVLDGFLNQELGIKLPDWEQLKQDITTNLKNLVTPEMKSVLESVGGSISEGIGTGGETLGILFTGMKEFGAWCVDNKEKISEFFGVMSREAGEGLVNAGSLFTIAMEAIKGLAIIGTEAVTGALEWIFTHGKETALILETLAMGFAVGAIAAHPYAAAIMLVASALGLMAANGGEDRYDHFFDGYSDEELAKLQEYVEAARELEQANKDMYDALDRGEDAISEGDAAAAAAARLEAIKAEVDEGLRGIYDSWNTGQDGYQAGMYFDVPLRVADGAEEAIQGEVGSFSLEAVVKMVPDYSQLNNMYRYIGGSPVRSIIEGSYASGLDYVPHDGFVAELHKGETVLNAASAEAWRSGGGNSRIEALLAQLVANTSGGQQIVLDSGALVGQIAPQMDARLGTISKRKGRGN